MPEDGDQRDDTDALRSQASDGRWLDRRSYLQLTGLAGVGATAALGVEKGSTAESLSDESRPRKHDELLVGVERGRDPRATIEPHLPADATIAHEGPQLSYASVQFPANASDAARRRFAEAIQRRDGVRYAESNDFLELHYSPDDPLFSNQTAVEMVNADEAWDVTLGSSDVTIAVLDQGAKYDHPDLTNNMASGVTNHGKDFVDDDGDPYPDDLSKEHHGSHVAGIAAASTDNGEGVAGVSDASILSGRVANENREGTRSDLADGITWATERGADVVNISLGGGGFSNVLKDAVEYAYQNGVFLVAAAGNNRGGSVEYPAAFSEVVAVSALDSDGNLAGYSSTGSEVELAAPGTAVRSTTTTDGYVPFSGTSMAAPVVSGVAALALSQWSLSNKELRRHLRRTAVDAGLSSYQQGFGRVDAYQAVATNPSGETSTGDSTVVEDFEDGDLSEYTFDRGSSGASVVSAPVEGGSYALEYSGTSTEAISTSGLDAYPSAGDSFTYWVRGTGGADMTNFAYGAQDHTNRYFVRVNVAEDRLKLCRYKSAETDLVRKDVTGFTLSQDAWYRVDVDWGTDGTHTATLFDSSGSQLADVTMSDSTWTSGGIGFDAYLSSGQSVYFDSVVLNGDGGSSGSSTETTVLDDFEDGSMADYSAVDTSGWTAETTKPHDGSYSAVNPSNWEGIYDNSVTIERGDTVESYAYLGTSNGVSTGVELWAFTNGDGSEKYKTYVSAENGKHWLGYSGSSTETFESNDSAAIPADEWIRIEMTTDSSLLESNVYDAAGNLISTISGEDARLTSGGYGFKDEWRDENPSVYVDDVTRRRTIASPLDSVDDFEDQSLSEYTIPTSPGSWKIASNFAFEGSYAAKTDSNGDVAYTSDTTFQRGDAVQANAYFAPTNGVSGGLEFWTLTSADATEKYVHRVSAEDGEHVLSYRSGMDEKVIDYDTDVTVPDGEWVRIETRTDDSTVEATLYDAQGSVVSTLGGTDTNLSSGGYGFKDEWQTESVTVYLDNVQVRRS